MLEFFSILFYLLTLLKQQTRFIKERNTQSNVSCLICTSKKLDFVEIEIMTAVEE